MPNKELLSLFPVFDAIFTEENLTRAAEKLGVSQSAVSQSLARLRHLTADELFLSNGRGMRPTPRAILMIPHVRAALVEALAVEHPKAFDLSTLERTFKVDVGAGFDCMLVPLIFATLESQAPRVRLHITSLRSTDPSQALRSGDIDIAFDFLRPSAPGIRSQSIAPSPVVVVSRRDHPALANGLSEALFLSMRHAQLNWSRTIAPSGIALELQRRGHNINVAVSVPTLCGLGATVATSELISTVSESAAHYLSVHYPLDIHRLPIILPDAQFYQCWHERFDNEEAHAWLRDLISRAARTTRESAPAPVST